MRATLVYNENSGWAAPLGAVVAELEGAGWRLDRCLAINDCFDHQADVVVVAGGDGTVGQVAKRLAGTGRPMAIVPMGTANNVARSLGIGVDPLAAAQGLARAVERRVDLGAVRDRGTREYFLEGFGLGVLAQVLAEKASEEDKKLTRALGLLADELESYEPRPIDLNVDGRDVSGLYLLAAVMNSRSLGPALCVAPEAKCDDGALDVVLVRPEARRALLAHLRRAAEEGDIALPAFETMRASRVRVRALGRWAHVDERPCQLHGEAAIDVAAGAVKILVPALGSAPEAKSGHGGTAPASGGVPRDT